jgi:hypothetical protein
MLDYSLNRLKEQYTKIKEKEKIEGGLADGKNINDIAKKHKVSVDHLSKQKSIGLDVEKEHTNNPTEANEIVNDHLWEDPNYYTKLSSIEEETINELQDVPKTSAKIRIGFAIYGSSGHKTLNDDGNPQIQDLLQLGFPQVPRGSPFGTFIKKNNDGIVITSPSGETGAGGMKSFASVCVFGTTDIKFLKMAVEKILSRNEQPMYRMAIAKMKTHLESVKESIGITSESWDDESYTDYESLFMNHFSGVREAAQKMGIDIESSRLINTKRCNLKAPTDIKDIKDSTKYHQWYGIGFSWLEWIQSEMPQWLAPCTYAIILDEKKILKVNSKQNITSFQNKYVISPERPKDMAINWEKLYNDGINCVEFNPYDKSFTKGKSEWYQTIDMPSGVVVNKLCIKKVIKLYDGTDDFRDMGVKI